MESGEESPVQNIHSKSCDMLNDLLKITDRIERKQYIRQYIESFDADNCVKVPDFQPDWQWFNVKTPLWLEANLHGKVLVLDFFTYCCINCMHILPDLEALESAHTDRDGLAIIGVHSAKFDNEKVSANILSAVLRYNISHPVVNDTQAVLWHALQIQCWPTLLVASPQGEVLFLLSGEGHRDILLDFVSEALDHYEKRGAINHDPIGILLEKYGMPEKTLSFPSKVCISADGKRLAIADTGHHRIYVTDDDGIILACVGGQAGPGFSDGCFEYAQFRSPQGVCFRSNQEIYVADTENHAIRKIDLKNLHVTTVAGTGSQGGDYEGGQVGKEQPISSPWDLSIAGSQREVLLITMAGTHQIWALFLEDTTWIKNTSYKAGTCIRFAGSGKEENRNNNYPHRAGFAQPSGLAVGKVSENSDVFNLYVADSESSTVRAVSLKDGAVKGLVGGELDPTNLFAFGDIDGKGSSAKLQHPLGVGVIPQQGSVLVADSYNHKIKLVNPLTRSCTTVLGSGCPGHGTLPGASKDVLNEPGGLAVHPRGDLVYIADTNNHCIKVYNLESLELYELPIITVPKKNKDMTDLTGNQHKPKKPRRLSPKTATKVTVDPVKVTPGQEVTIQLFVDLPENFHLNLEAPNRWAVYAGDSNQEHILDGVSYGDLSCVSYSTLTTLTLPASLATPLVAMETDVSLYLCSDEGLCSMAEIIFVLSLEMENSDNSGQMEENSENQATSHDGNQDNLSKSNASNGIPESNSGNSSQTVNTKVLLSHKL